MGAFEFLSKPVVGSLKAGAVTTTAITLKAKVDPEGLASYVQIVATHAGKTVKSPLTSVGKGRTAKPMTITLGHLKPHTRYRAHISVVSVAGHTVSAARTIQTKRLPKKHHKK